MKNTILVLEKDEEYIFHSTTSSFSVRLFIDEWGDIRTQKIYSNQRKGKVW